MFTLKWTFLDFGKNLVLEKESWTELRFSGWTLNYNELLQRVAWNVTRILHCK